jgi:transcriptional regulator with XRE-family HTH domain
MSETSQRARAQARFAENVLSLRNRAGLSQAEAGARAELHRTEVSNIERCLRVPRLATIIKVAGAIEVLPVELLEGLSWEIDPARRWLPATRPNPEMTRAPRQQSAWINGGWVRIES